jgi:penicillin-binding protein 1A
VENGVKMAQALGDKSYCSNNEDAGLSLAIGGGCSVRQDEHTNAFATLARGGNYKPLTYATEVKNSSNEKLKEWKDSSESVLNEQAAYMLTDILSDTAARSLVFGAQGSSFGFVVPGVWTASKTGTTDDGRGNAKDSWMMSYSPVVATGVWSGNHDGAALASSSNTTVRRVMNDFMKAVHENVYAKIGKWKTGDKIARPAGIQNCSINGKNDICPSWWSKNKTNSTSNEIEFDSISKKKATQCTPESTRVKITVYENTDPVTKKKTVSAPEGYDASADDDVHNCSDAQPAINSVTYSSLGGNSNNYRINISIAQGKFSLKSVTVKVDGNVVSNATPNGGPLSVDYTFTKAGQTVSVEVLDEGGYATTKSYNGPAITTSSRE